MKLYLIYSYPNRNYGNASFYSPVTHVHTTVCMYLLIVVITITG